MNPGNDVIPGNRTQQNPEPRSPGLTVDRSPSQITCCQEVLMFAPSQRPGPWESAQTECVEMWLTLAQVPAERPLALCPKEKKGNTGAPGQATSPLPSHPGKPESFPYVCGWGFLRVCLPQASPGRCGSKVCGSGVSPPQGRAGWAGWGESRQHWLPRMTPCPQGGLLHPRWVPEQTHVSAGNRSSSGQHTGHAQLSKLQAVLADGHCHFTASHWMWLMRGALRSPPQGGVGQPRPCP